MSGSDSGSESLNQYLTVTACYWLFTITDGALRMLVVLHFHNLGYNALQIALLFLFYEAFGVLTNLFGGYMANAAGRLAGTVSSGWLYLNGSLVLCLAGASALLLGSSLTSLKLPDRNS